MACVLAYERAIHKTKLYKMKAIAAVFISIVVVLTCFNSYFLFLRDNVETPNQAVVLKRL